MIVLVLLWSVAGVALACLAASPLVLLRINRVAAFRLAQLELAGAQAKAAIHDGDFAWQRFYEESPVERHSFDEMMVKFWRPLRPEYWR